jgi:hypothetical protein
LGNSNDLRSGERVIAIGSPRGLQGTVTTGVVSALRDDPGGAGFKVIQTDASVNPGNSGGPLLNDRAQAIGVVTFKLRGSEGLNFAVPINYIRGMLDGPLTALSLDELRAKLANKTDVFQKGEGFPTRWKSLASGTTKIIRRDGDHLYIETVLPDAAKQAGCFALADLLKQGDTYSGTFKESCVCQYQKRRGLTVYYDTITNRFTNEWRQEITKLDPTRIEGSGTGEPEDAKFNCEKRTYSKPPITKSFVWIPE